MKKLAVMQPYWWPYLGYFQLINQVDEFIVYDDVNFIKRGWVNRNRVLVNGQATMITLPVKKASQNVLIKDLELGADNKWLDKFYKTLELAYKKAPYFEDVMHQVIRPFTLDHKGLVEAQLQGITLVCAYLSLPFNYKLSSGAYTNQNLHGQDRILDICLKEKAQHYINPIGGQDLYDKAKFSQVGLGLSFIQMNEHHYKQGKHPFVAGLSIIDVLMFNSVEDSQALLQQFTLV